MTNLSGNGLTGWIVEVMRYVAILCIALFQSLVHGVLAAEPPKKEAPGVTPLPDPSGVHNLFALGTNVFSGSTPEGEEGFAALQRLGVRTILSVDGARPDVELARKHGLRYVHLPHGYDGISPALQLQLAKVGSTLPGPIYVHCHHGKHRGPAAAAVICLTKDGWTVDQADAWLRAAGTATNYAGLYKTIREFKHPGAEAIRAATKHFPETAQVSGLVDAMVGIDERWEHLKDVRAAGYQSPKNHPDIQPANEAVILWEQYREAQRLPEAIQLGTDFIRKLKAAEEEVQEAERLLRLSASDPSAELRHRLDRSFEAVGKSCASCHRDFRDVGKESR
jgi:hypothetical protein